MPLRKQIPAKPSARAVYSKQSASKETAEKGRGRPKKNSTSPTRVKPLAVKQAIDKKGRGRPKKPTTSSVKVKADLQKKKNSPKTRKRKTSVSFKSTTEIIEDHSSEADLSSEGEESDHPNDEGLEDVEQESNDVEVSDEESEGGDSDVDESEGDESEDEESDGDESEIEDEEDIESSGEEGDVAEQLVRNENNEELVSTDEMEGEEDDSENAFYSFPETSNQSPTKLEETNDEQENASSSDSSYNEKVKNEDGISGVRFKNEIKEENTQNVINSKKRKITRINTKKTDESEQNDVKPPKKKKKLGQANLSVESSSRSFSAPGSSRLPSFSPQHHVKPNQSSLSHSSTNGLHPHVDCIDSLIGSNKTVPCGNIAADQAFRYLIGPTLPVDFFHNMFEKMPFTVARENRNYYKSLFSGNDLNTMLKEYNLEYKVHIDVVKYIKGMRLPISANGRAYYSTVWEDYKDGFSLRVRNPQAYNKNLWNMCSLLQEYFSSTVGCNVYLTPPKAQGFPPHYDDIDAFIVQVEGKKYWKVYAPRYPEEELARYSSKDFTQNEIGAPILQACLKAGEMLYIPRGYIHQAATDADQHSLHLTFSTNQLNTWGDFLLTATSKAVERAMLNDVTFRQSISKDYMDYIGTCVAESKSFKRYEIINKIKELARKAMTYIDVDEAADLHTLKFLETSLPPTFTKIEKERSLHGNGSFWKNGKINLKGLIVESTEIQLIKKRNQRLIIDDNNPRLYHTLENLRDPKPVAEEEAVATYVEFEMGAVPSYLFLLNKYPEFVKVGDIPLQDTTDKISFATSLYENGLLMTKEPLPPGSEADYPWLRTEGNI